MDSFLYFCTLEEIKSNKEDNMAGLYEQIINQLFKAKLEKYDRKIYLVIADDGKKIPKDISSCMYEPFVKGDQSRNDSSNSGLGLAIVKKVLDAHEAAIYFEQPYKKYTKAFIIVMPVK